MRRASPRPTADPGALAPATEQLERYFAGDRRTLDVDLADRWAQRQLALP